MSATTTMIAKLCLTLLLIAAISAKRPSIELVLRDTKFGRFLSSEFNYTAYLDHAEVAAEKMVPFQDTNNDTFFNVGLIHKSQLQNYTSLNLTEQFGDVKNKAWLPISSLKEELANCLQSQFAHLHQHDFKYDKGVYGWLNIMKFACAEVTEGFYVYGVAFSKTRFRLKQVLLRRQDNSVSRYWASDGRSIISRDVQKIVEVFSTKFAHMVQDKCEEELQLLTGNIKKKYKERTVPFLKLTNEALKEIKSFFPTNLRHTSTSVSRAHTFNTLALPVKTRVILTKIDRLPLIVENLTEDLTDESLEVLDSCNKKTCTYNNKMKHTYNEKTQTYNYVKERVLSHKLTTVDTLLMIQSAHAYFHFDSTKRKTDHGLVNVKQHLDQDAQRIWEALLDQQFAHSIHMHSHSFFNPVANTPAVSTFSPLPSPEHLESLELELED